MYIQLTSMGALPLKYKQEKRVKKRKFYGTYRGIRVQAVMVFVVLLTCTYYIRMQMRKADRDMRDELLARTRLMAEGVNPKRIRALSGTSEDLNNPAYLRVKNQLVLLKKQHPDIRFIYLLGYRSDGSMFFYIDSEPLNSPNYSPPGEAFVPESDLSFAALKRGSELVIGPGADRWGVWVSAFVPIENSVTEKTETFLGADIDARIWRRNVLVAGLPGFILLLLLTGILLLWIWLAHRWLQPGMREPKWLNGLDLVCVLAIGIILSLFIPWRIYLQEAKNREQFFQQLASSETAQIARNLKRIRSPGLEGLASFFYQGDIIHKDDFFHYTQYLIDNPMVDFWLWAPAIPAADADDFEMRIRQEEHADFKIRSAKTADPDSRRRQNTLFPVVFVAPADRNQQIIGFDLGSESIRQDAIHAAIRSRLATATEPVHLLANDENERIIIVFRPVFYPGQDDRLKGVAAMGLRLSSIQSLNESKKNLIHIDLSMLQEQGQPKLLSKQQYMKNTQEKAWIQRYLFAFGKVFLLSAVPGKEFLQKYPLWRHGVALLACFAFTAAAGIIVSLISRRRTELEALVRERTLKLTESEYRFRQLSVHSLTLIWDIDERGLFTFVNEVSETLLGYPPDEMTGQMFFYDLFPEESRETCKKQLQDLLHSQKPMIRLEQALGTKMGGTVWVSSQGMPLFNADGSLAGYRGESTDVTEREKAEQEKERQTRFQKMLTQVAAKYINLPLGQIEESIDHSLAELGSFLAVDRFYVFEYDSENQYCSNTHEWCAPGITALIGTLQKIPFAEFVWWREALRKDAVLNIPDVELLPEGEKDRNILESQGVQSLLCVPMQEGEHCWGFTGFDCVRQKHAFSEEETRLLNVFAQMLVNVRGRIRKETELQQSQEQAAAASQAKSDFLTRMSHEIRTPLNGIIGVADLLTESRLDNEQQRLVEIVFSSGKLLLELVNDILDFARIEAGKLELRVSEFDLDELLRSLTGSLAFTAGTKNVELILAVSPQVPARVCCDQLRLQQVIMNLAGNAVKFTEQGEVVICIELEKEDAAALVLRFTVRDTGIGIPKDQQAFLFDAFYQADSSNQRRFGGTGLGLPITRRLIEKMGGTLEFTSELGKGSEFSFNIPLKQGADNQPSEPLSTDWQNARILIADDNESLCKSLQQQLCALSMSPAEAHDADCALKLLLQANAEKKPFRAALIDWTFSGLAAQIRQNPELAGLKLIALLPINSKIGTALEGNSGFDRIISKPLSRPELLEALRSLSNNGTKFPHPAAATPAATLSNEWSKRNLEVLLAEDNLTNQKIMTLLLNQLGLRVDIAVNGLETLESLEAKQYAAVLMDIQMPDLDGLEATQRIRDPQSPVLDHHVPIIAVTAHAIEGYREVCRQAGMDDYITKPVTLLKLREVLQHWLPPPS